MAASGLGLLPFSPRDRGGAERWVAGVRPCGLRKASLVGWKEAQSSRTETDAGGWGRGCRAGLVVLPLGTWFSWETDWSYISVESDDHPWERPRL